MEFKGSSGRSGWVGASQVSESESASPAGGGEGERLRVLKTYKIYIGGKFPRTESGRYYVARDPQGKALANVCWCSRKDVRDAVSAARAAQPGWAKATAYNRGQVLYRVAEVLEGRRPQFVAELMEMGATAEEAEREVSLTVDRWVYYAGWSDKYQQLFSAVNPVAAPYFNFSMPEPMGVVTAVAPEQNPLLGLSTAILPAIVGGNTVVVLASETRPLAAVTLTEVLATSDVPGGVVNLVTGTRKELLPHLTSHMDVNAVLVCDPEESQDAVIDQNAALNVKRVARWKCRSEGSAPSWENADAWENPYRIQAFQETKTTWHPVGV